MLHFNTVKYLYRFRCGCGKSYVQPKTLRLHQRSCPQHTAAISPEPERSEEVRSFPCSCGQTFSSHTDLQNHKLTCAPLNYIVMNQEPPTVTSYLPDEVLDYSRHSDWSIGLQHTSFTSLNWCRITADIQTGVLDYSIQASLVWTDVGLQQIFRLEYWTIAYKLH